LTEGYTSLATVVPILIPVNANGVRCLLNLPRLAASTLAECGQEQIQRLLKGVGAVLSGKEQELPHPPHQVGPMLRQGQLPFP